MICFALQIVNLAKDQKELAKERVAMEPLPDVNKTAKINTEKAAAEKEQADPAEKDSKEQTQTDMDAAAAGLDILKAKNKTLPEVKKEAAKESVDAGRSGRKKDKQEVKAEVTASILIALALYLLRDECVVYAYLHCFYQKGWA